MRLLKIDAEGFDKHVLEGFPWDRTKPAAIMCESRTARPSRSDTPPPTWPTCSSRRVPRLCERVAPDRALWRAARLAADVPVGLGLTPADQSWGNLIAFRYKADADAFEELVRDDRRG